MAWRSGRFRVVDRAAGLRGTAHQQVPKDSGVLLRRQAPSRLF
jgi:hypothetical protein